jgi:hypothetical protein
MPKKRFLVFAVALLALVLVVGVLWLGERTWRRARTVIFRTATFRQFWNDPTAHTDWMISVGKRCGDAPFVFPTTGFIGFLWDDSFRVSHRHQGIDIFDVQRPGVSEVIAAYPGYLTRRPDWKSTVAIYIPQDPLHPQRAIWTYYTHLASPAGESYISAEFPPGSENVYVEAGTFLGYQGNYSGDPNNPTGVHLHFSIVKPDAAGALTNELDLRNTYDPSPYLGLNVNAGRNWGDVPLCP